MAAWPAPVSGEVKQRQRDYMERTGRKVVAVEYRRALDIDSRKPAADRGRAGIGPTGRTERERANHEG
jgi:hypothetical protein